MKNALLVLLFVSAAGWSQQVPQGFHNGQEFLDMTPDRQRTLVRGLFSGLLAATLFGAPIENVIELQDCASRMNDGQLTAIAKKYVRNHPEEWHIPLSVSVWRSFDDVCEFSWARKEVGVDREPPRPDAREAWQTLPLDLSVSSGLLPSVPQETTEKGKEGSSRRERE